MGEAGGLPPPPFPLSRLALRRTQLEVAGGKQGAGEEA